VERQLSDGRVLAVIPLTFGRARLVVARGPGWMLYDDGW
jgi:ATP phosphoribosyltransferase